jgi:capsid protein
MGGDIEELLPARKNEVEQAEQLGLFFDTILSNTPKQQSGTNIESNDTDTNGKET